MSVSREQRHLRGHPCPVCGGKDEDPRGKEVRCSGFTSRDGMWCRCSREELAGAIDQDKDGLFRHMMRGPCDCGVTHGERREGPVPEAVYRYTDEEDRTIFEVVRFPGKKIRQRVPDGSGGYSWKLNGARRTLYRLPALLLDAGSTVYVVEGEKDADTLARAGLLATTNPHGAGKWHTVQEHAATVLRDRVVVVIADADEPGRDHARNVVRCLRRVARSVRLTECPSPHKDVSDLYAAGGTVADLLDTPLEPRPALAPEPEPVSADRWDDESEGPASAPVRRASIAAPRLRVKAEVQVSMVDIHETIDQTIDVMRADPRLFVRAHELVTVIGADAGDALISKGSPIIRPHCHSSLLPRLTRHCSFMRYQPPSKKAVEAEELGPPRRRAPTSLGFHPRSSSPACSPRGSGRACVRSRE